MNPRLKKSTDLIVRSLGIAIILIVGAIAFKSGIFKNMDARTMLVLTILIIALVMAVALSFKPLRKTLGLLLVILGALACLASILGTLASVAMFSFVGLALGIPMGIVGLVSGVLMIVVGGFFLFA